jgi:hypothetical protein
LPRRRRTSCNPRPRCSFANSKPCEDLTMTSVNHSR